MPKIEHARRVIGAHKRHVKFEDYGDAQAYRSYLETHRQALKAEGKDHSNDHQINVLCAVDSSGAP